MTTPTCLAPATASAEPGGVALAPASSSNPTAAAVPTGTGPRKDFSSLMANAKNSAKTGLPTTGPDGKTAKPALPPVADFDHDQAKPTPSSLPTVPASATRDATSDDPATGAADPKHPLLPEFAPLTPGELDPSITTTLMAMMLQVAPQPLETRIAVKLPSDVPTAPVQTGTFPTSANPKGEPTGSSQTSPRNTTQTSSMGTTTVPPTPTLPQPVMFAPNQKPATTQITTDTAATKISNPTSDVKDATQKQVVNQASKAPIAPISAPADISPSVEPTKPASIAQDPSILQQLVVEYITPPPADVKVNGLIDGTGVALIKPRMKFAAEKNEITGPTLQNLQGKTSYDVSTDADGLKPLSGFDSTLLGRKKDALAMTPNFTWPAKPEIALTTTPTLSEVSQASAQSAAHIERVAQFVNEKVTLLHQTGSESLGVSLKLDAHTQISLQLTTQNGQIQATLRAERGSLTGLEGHWNDLQASLAKQNVQLLPMDDKATARALPATATSGQGSFSNFNQSSQQSPRQTREISPEWPATAAAAKTVRNPQPQNQKSSPQGWESWA